MAKITNVVLSLTVDIANVNVKVDYDIAWSTYDQASDQPYLESVRLIGDDTGMNPPEDGVDDILTTISPIFIPVTLRSAGAPTTHRSFTRTIAKASLNEDPLGTDEIRALVRLTPVPVSEAKLESNLVTINA